MVFRLAQASFKYRLFRLARLVPEPVVHGIGAWLGVNFIARGSKAKERVVESLRALYRDRPLEERRYHDLATRALKFMGLLAFDTIFVFPSLTPARLRKRLRFEGLDNYRAAREGGRGVIVVSVHLSQFFHGIVATPLVDPVPRVYAIANVKNAALYSLPFHENGVKLVPSVAFSKIKATLTRILSEGNLLLVAWDMGSAAHQLKVPFVHSLLPTPGSVVSLARETGAPVLPVVMVPRGSHSAHVLRFLPPIRVEDRATKKDTFGHYNAMLNRAFAPYLRAYPFLWEEVLSFANRSRLTFKFPNGSSLQSLVGLAASFIRWLAETSWEPERDDAAFLNFSERLRRLAGNPATSEGDVITLHLPNSSAREAVTHLAEFLVAYPDVGDFLSSEDRKALKTPTSNGDLRMKRDLITLLQENLTQNEK